MRVGPEKPFEKKNRYMIKIITIVKVTRTVTILIKTYGLGRSLMTLQKLKVKGYWTMIVRNWVTILYTSAVNGF